MLGTLMTLGMQGHVPITFLWAMQPKVNKCIQQPPTPPKICYHPSPPWHISHQFSDQTGAVANSTVSNLSFCLH